jgi:type IV fimbrial biogenesis protein FimT
MNRPSGFTIIELMAVVAIAGVLMMVALPSYENLVRNNCRTTAANALVTSLQYARSEAVKQRQRISIAAGNAASAGNEWGTGWTVFRDADGDNVVDPGEELRVTELTCEQPAGGTNRMTISSASTLLTYLSTGFSAGTAAITIDICHANETGERGRRITILTTGRPSMNSSFVCT